MSNTLTLTPDELRAWDKTYRQTLGQFASPRLPAASEDSATVADAHILQRRKRTAEAPKFNVHAPDCIEGQDSGLADCTCGAGNDPWRTRKPRTAEAPAPAPRGGWRLLEEGEVIAEGDEEWLTVGQRWVPVVRAIHGSAFCDVVQTPVRRRMEARDE